MTDFPMTATVLTSDEVRQIATDVISSQLDAIETRLNSSLRTTLSEALRNVPTEDTVRKMIDVRVADTRTELQASITSIDAHLRQAEGLVSQAGKRMDRAADRFDSFVTKADELLAELKAKTEVNTGNIASIHQEIEGIRTQSDIDRNEWTQTTERLGDLRADVHGDPTKPEMPSLSRVVALTRDSIESLDKRLARYDTMTNFVLWVWSKPAGKAVIITLTGAVATDLVYQATKIWQVLLGGKP